MKRGRAFDIAAGVSLVLLVLVILSCVAAAIWEPKFMCARDGVLWEVGLSPGHGWVTWVEGWPVDQGWERVPRGEWNSFSHYRNLDDGGPYREWNALVAWGNRGFVEAGGWKRKVWDARPVKEHGYLRNVAVATWPFVVATGVLPAWWAAAWGMRWWAERRRARAGLCKRCGYDLRASPERCPECGTAVETEKSVAGTGAGSSVTSE